jgi:hypothetical protein
MRKPSIAVIALLLQGTPAIAFEWYERAVEWYQRAAHENPHWYPWECCHNQDCAPVDSVVEVIVHANGHKQLVVKSKHGTVEVPVDLPARESKDGRMHVCIRPEEDFSKMKVICVFLPPDT